MTKYVAGLVTLVVLVVAGCGHQTVSASAASKTGGAPSRTATATVAAAPPCASVVPAATVVGLGRTTTQVTVSMGQSLRVDPKTPVPAGQVDILERPPSDLIPGTQNGALGNADGWMFTAVSPGTSTLAETDGTGRTLASIRVTVVRC